MSYNLFIDDIRDPKDGYLHGVGKKLVDHSGIPAGNWEVVRDFDQFVHKLKTRGIPLRVSFDNDLSEKHLKYYYEAVASGVFDWKNAQPKMGLHALEYLVSFCARAGKPLPECFVHTANHLARAEMDSILGNIKKNLDIFSVGGILLPE